MTRMFLVIRIHLILSERNYDTRRHVLSPNLLITFYCLQLLDDISTTTSLQLFLYAWNILRFSVEATSILK